MKKTIEIPSNKYSEGAIKAFNERMKQQDGYRVVDDAALNGSFQLAQAAQTLSKLKMTQDDEFAPPLGWDEGLWVKTCRKDYYDRLIIASALLMAEYDRIDYMDTEDEEWNPANIKSKSE